MKLPLTPTPDDYRRAEGADDPFSNRRADGGLLYYCEWCRGDCVSPDVCGAAYLEQKRRRETDGEYPALTPRYFSVPDVPTDDKREQRIEAGPSVVLRVGAAVMAALIVGLAIVAWSAWR